MARVMLATDPGPPRTRGLLRALLEAAGHEVYEVSDGEVALAEIGAVRPELLILDTALPTLDGVQVLARLHVQPGAPRFPVLVISTIPAQLGRRLVESFGATSYLPKPFTYQALGQAVEAILAPPAAPGGDAAAPPTERASGTNGTGPRRLDDAEPTPPRQERSAG